MRKLLTGLMIGIVLGSLFVVTGGHFSEKPSQVLQPNLAPSLNVSRVTGHGYTAYLFTGKGGIALDPSVLMGEVETLADSYGYDDTHLIAIPVNEKGTVVVGYGVEFFKDGRIAVDVIRAPVYLLPNITEPMVIKKLDKWSREIPYFHPDIKAKYEVGVPEGYGAKTKNASTGKTTTMRHVSSSRPYWHDFGVVESQVMAPPYGNVYMDYHVWELCNDSDPSKVWIAVAGDGAPDLTGNYYLIEPGVELRGYFGETDYGDFKTKRAVISHRWGLDPSLHPNLGPANPMTLPGGQTLMMGVGWDGASIPYQVMTPDGGMLSYTDHLISRADWILNFRTNSESAKTTFRTMVGSAASFSQKALQDGKWHRLVEVGFNVTFERQYREYLIVPRTETHMLSLGVIWMMKVG